MVKTLKTSVYLFCMYDLSYVLFYYFSQIGTCIFIFQIQWNLIIVKLKGTKISSLYRIFNILNVYKSTVGPGLTDLELTDNPI